MTTPLWAMGLVIFAAFVGAIGPILLKKAAASDIHINLSALKNKNLVLGILVYGIATIMFFPAVKAGDLSVIYPLVSTTYIWVSLLSMKLLGEKMSKWKWGGIALILIGVTFIGLGSQH